MKPAPTYLGHAGEQLAVKRLGAFQRIAELVGEQEEALANEDLDRFEALTAELRGLRAEVGRLGPVEDGQDQESQQITDALRAAVEGTERVQSRLAQLRGEQAGEIRKVQQSRPRMRTYITKDEGDPPTLNGLDVRF